MRTALLLILLTGFVLASEAAAHAQDADAGLRAEAAYTLGVTAAKEGRVTQDRARVRTMGKSPFLGKDSTRAV